MEHRYTRLDDGYYRCVITSDPFGSDPIHHLITGWPTMDRREMVSLLCKEIGEQLPKQVEVYIGEMETPLFLNYKTVQDIIEGKRSAKDFIFGDSLYTPYTRMWESISRWFVLRSMPGQEDMYECPACGRGAHLEGNLHCDKCGLTFIASAKYWGVSIDLLDSLLTNKDREMYYVDRPWNDNPPWMTRGELTKALGLYMDAVRAFTED